MNQQSLATTKYSGPEAKIITNKLPEMVFEYSSQGNSTTFTLDADPDFQMSIDPLDVADPNLFEVMINLRNSLGSLKLKYSFWGSESQLDLLENTTILSNKESLKKYGAVYLYNVLSAIKDEGDFFRESSSDDQSNKPLKDSELIPILENNSEGVRIGEIGFLIPADEIKSLWRSFDSVKALNTRPELFKKQLNTLLEKIKINKASITPIVGAALSDLLAKESRTASGIRIKPVAIYQFELTDSARIFCGLTSKEEGSKLRIIGVSSREKLNHTQSSSIPRAISEFSKYLKAFEA